MENQTRRHTKYVGNFNDFIEVSKRMNEFQTIHNIIRNEYIELLKLTEAVTANQDQFNALYRACLRELFSLIEADLYGFNQIDAYQGYRDHEKFVKKFKHTFDHVADIWQKSEVKESYFLKELDSLLRVKHDRDKTTHPKSKTDFNKVSGSSFTNLKNVFYSYDSFMNALMNDFFVSVKISSFL
jgi:hypothetical protein